MTDNTLIFADVSSNNGPNIDLAAYARDGHKILAPKATEADNYTNPYFARWRDQAHTLGLRLGIYHFARPGIDGRTEAAHYLDVIGGLRANEFPIIDIEGSGWLGSEAEDDLRAFAAAVKTPGWCYASLSFIGDEGLWLPAGWSWWIAAWGSQRPSIARMAAWQFTETGSAAGIGDGHVDLSLITAAAPTPQGDDVQHPTLKLNDHGRPVYALQTILRGYQEHLGLPRSAHCPVPITGTFDANTKGALQDVQKAWGDATDFGVCTPHVWWMLTGQFGPDPKGN